MEIPQALIVSRFSRRSRFPKESVKCLLSRGVFVCAHNSPIVYGQPFGLLLSEISKILYLAAALRQKLENG